MPLEEPRDTGGIASSLAGLHGLKGLGQPPPTPPADLPISSELVAYFKAELEGSVAKGVSAGIVDGVNKAAEEHKTLIGVVAVSSVVSALGILAILIALIAKAKE